MAGISWWDKDATVLQRMSDDYPGVADGMSKDHFNVVVQHTRQDLVLVVSYLSSVNKQVYHVKLLLGAIGVLLLSITLRIHAFW